VSKVEGCGHLNGDVVNLFNVAFGDVYGQIQVQTFDVGEHRAALGMFAHRKLVFHAVVHELVKSSYDVRVSLQIYPLLNVLLLPNLLNHKLLSEVFVVHHKTLQRKHVLNLDTFKLVSSLSRQI